MSQHEWTYKYEKNVAAWWYTHIKEYVKSKNTVNGEINSYYC